MSVFVRRFAVALTFVMTSTLVAVPGATEACVTEPPPAGIAARCLSRTISFTETMGHEARQAVLTVGLSEWMESCFPGQGGLMYASEEGEASVERIFELVKDLSGSTPSVRVAADYTARTSTEGGRTCYAVESVVFRLPGASGTVDLDGEIEITPGPPSDLVKEAASAGKKALQHPSVQGSAALSKMLGVLQAMETHGRDINDTWYDVTPTLVRPIGGDLGLNDFVPIACFTDSSGERPQCLGRDEAKNSCARHFADQLVTAYDSAKADPVQYAKTLIQISKDIQSGVNYLNQFTHLEAPTNVVPCESIKDFMDRIGTLAERHSIYMAGQY